MSLQRLISRVRNEFTRNISFIILFLVGIAFVLLFVQYRQTCGNSTGSPPRLLPRTAWCAPADRRRGETCRQGR